MRTLTIIGGESGKADGDKVVLHVVHALIAKDFLSSITWTGRSGKALEQKVALMKYPNIIRVVSTLCGKADQKYGWEKVHKGIVYKVLKYAYNGRSATNELIAEEMGSNSKYWKKQKVSQYQQDHQRTQPPISSTANQATYSYAHTTEYQHTPSVIEQRYEKNHRYESAYAYEQSNNHPHTQIQISTDGLSYLNL